MKLKINSFYIICIIILEIVLIEVLLISFYVSRNRAEAKEAVNIEVNISSVREAKTASNEGKAGSKAINIAKSASNAKANIESSDTKPKIKSDTGSKKNSGIKAESNHVNKNENKQEMKFSMLDQPYGNIFYKMVSKSIFHTGRPRDLKIADEKDDTRIFIATTYDLSYESCGKLPSHPAYGITFSGKKAVKGRTVAVDPTVIPLGSSVYIEFPGEYSKLNGWYTAEDTGSKVKGNIIDIFLGESAFKEMERFGSRSVKVKVIYPK